jgi:hypothetical protein
MNEQEAVEKIIKALDKVESAWESSYRESRLPIIAKHLYKDLKSPGLAQQKVEWKDKPDSAGWWWYKIPDEPPKPFFVMSKNGVLWLEPFGSTKYIKGKWAKAFVPEAPKEGE